MQKTNNWLLDTHIWVWASNGDAKVAFLENLAGTFSLSAISVWEVAMLHAKKRLQFKDNLPKWIDIALRRSGVELIDLEPEIAIASCQLKGEFHGDPADRIIVASAILRDIPLITADEKIIAYCKKQKIKLIEVN